MMVHPRESICGEACIEVPPELGAHVRWGGAGFIEQYLGRATIGREIDPRTGGKRIEEHIARGVTDLLSQLEILCGTKPLPARSFEAPEVQRRPAKLVAETVGIARGLHDVPQCATRTRSITEPFQHLTFEQRSARGADRIIRRQRVRACDELSRRLVLPR
jgi:hypothetical protein